MQHVLYLGSCKYAGIALISHVGGSRYVQTVGQVTQQDTPVIILHQHMKMVQLQMNNIYNSKITSHIISISMFICTGTAIEMYFRFPPLPSLNISACASVYPNCSDAPIQTCRNYAGVICTEKCETPTVVTTTQYPTTSQPTPTPICNGILDPCTVGIVILGLLAALLLILLIASVVGCLCTCVGCLCASCVATQRSKSTQHDAVHLSKM